MSEKQSLKDLSPKEQMNLVDRGELAACGFCGAMTWKEDLQESGRCVCGELPYIAGGEVPEMNDSLGSGDTMDFVDKLDHQIQRSIRKVQDTSLMKPLVKLPQVSKNHPVEREDSREVGSSGPLADAVYSLRVNLGVTQEDLAEALGCHRNTVMNLETGKSTKLQMRTRRKLEVMAEKAEREDLVGKFVGFKKPGAKRRKLKR